MRLGSGLLGLDFLDLGFGVWLGLELLLLGGVRRGMLRYFGTVAWYVDVYVSDAAVAAGRR